MASPVTLPSSFSLINLLNVDIVSLALVKDIVPLTLAILSNTFFLKIPSTLAIFIKFAFSFSESLFLVLAIISLFLS